MLEECCYRTEIGPGIRAGEVEDPSGVQAGGSEGIVAHHLEQQPGGRVHNGGITGEQGLREIE